MAFFNKARSILQHAVSKHINHEIAAPLPSIFQVIRCMSSSKLFVGGLSYTTDEPSLREAFNKYGDVVEARVIVDRDTGRSRGFGFVTYTDSEAASSAIQALDGQDLHGRRVRVNFANDRTRGYGGGGGGFGSYGGGGGYGGGGSGYGGGGGNYNTYGGNSGGYGTGGGDSYGSGGYGTGGGDSYGSGGASNYGGGSYGSGSNDASGYGSTGNNYDSGVGNLGGGTSQSVDTAGGIDSYSSGGNFESSSGYTGNQGLNYGSSGDQFGTNEGSGSFKQDDTPEGNYQDDNEPEDYMDKRT